jgi:hypothetical protein
MTLFRLTARIRLRNGRTIYFKQFIRHGSAVPIVQHPMQLILALDHASSEILKSLRSRFAPDCPTLLGERRVRHSRQPPFKTFRKIPRHHPTDRR